MEASSAGHVVVFRRELSLFWAECADCDVIEYLGIGDDAAWYRAVEAH